MNAFEWCFVHLPRHLSFRPSCDLCLEHPSCVIILTPLTLSGSSGFWEPALWVPAHPIARLFCGVSGVCSLEVVASAAISPWRWRLPVAEVKSFAPLSFGSCCRAAMLSQSSLNWRSGSRKLMSVWTRTHLQVHHPFWRPRMFHYFRSPCGHRPWCLAPSAAFCWSSLPQRAFALQPCSRRLMHLWLRGSGPAILDWTHQRHRTPVKSQVPESWVRNIENHHIRQKIGKWQAWSLGVSTQCLSRVGVRLPGFKSQLCFMPGCSLEKLFKGSDFPSPSVQWW